MIGTTFNEKLQIVEVKFKGNVELDELLHFIFNIGQNKYLPGKCNILIDATESVYDFGIETLDVLVRNIEANSQRFIQLKGAFIHNNAKDTAISITLERNIKFSHYLHKTFCTNEAALQWLGVNEYTYQ